MATGASDGGSASNAPLQSQIPLGQQPVQHQEPECVIVETETEVLPTEQRMYEEGNSTRGFGLDEKTQRALDFIPLDFDEVLERDIDGDVAMRMDDDWRPVSKQRSRRHRYSGGKRGEVEVVGGDERDGSSGGNVLMEYARGLEELLAKANTEVDRLSKLLPAHLRDAKGEKNEAASAKEAYTIDPENPNETIASLRAHIASQETYTESLELRQISLDAELASLRAFKNLVHRREIIRISHHHFFCYERRDKASMAALVKSLRQHPDFDMSGIANLMDGFFGQWNQGLNAQANADIHNITLEDARRTVRWYLGEDERVGLAGFGLGKAMESLVGMMVGWGDWLGGATAGDELRQARRAVEAGGVKGRVRFEDIVVERQRQLGFRNPMDPTHPAREVLRNLVGGADPGPGPTTSPASHRVGEGLNQSRYAPPENAPTGSRKRQRAEESPEPQQQLIQCQPPPCRRRIQPRAKPQNKPPQPTQEFQPQPQPPQTQPPQPPEREIIIISSSPEAATGPPGSLFYDSMDTDNDTEEADSEEGETSSSFNDESRSDDDEGADDNDGDWAITSTASYTANANRATNSVNMKRSGKFPKCVPPNIAFLPPNYVFRVEGQAESVDKSTNGRTDPSTAATSTKSTSNSIVSFPPWNPFNQSTSTITTSNHTSSTIDLTTTLLKNIDSGARFSASTSAAMNNNSNSNSRNSTDPILAHLPRTPDGQATNTKATFQPSSTSRTNLTSSTHGNHNTRTNASTSTISNKSNTSINGTNPITISSPPRNPFHQTPNTFRTTASTISQNRNDFPFGRPLALYTPADPPSLRQQTRQRGNNPFLIRDNTSTATTVAPTNDPQQNHSPALGSGAGPGTGTAK